MFAVDLTGSSSHNLVAWIKQWRRPGAGFGGRRKNFRGPRFLNDVFSEKVLIFTAKISDDLFPFFSHSPVSRPKFLMTFFLLIDQVFRIFPLSFPRFSVSFTMFNVVYDPFLTRTTTISEKNSFMTPFLLCSYFRAHPTTLLLKISGVTDAWAVPHLKFVGGTVPPVPFLGLRLWHEGTHLWWRVRWCKLLDQYRLRQHWAIIRRLGR